LELRHKECTLADGRADFVAKLVITPILPVRVRWMHGTYKPVAITAREGGRRPSAEELKALLK